MNLKRLEKLQAELKAMRGNPQRARDLEQVAKKLGREVSTRGKEPNWVSIEFPDLRPISIPHHGGKDLSVGVKNSILNQLDDDICSWIELLQNENYESLDEGDDDGN